jgi:CRISPR-associated protein Csx10
MLIKMTLLSDTVPGCGEGLAGILDTDIAYDDVGLPIIPAKRLKGLMRESAMELEALGAIPQGTAQALFGAGHAASGAEFRLSNGYIHQYEQTRRALLSLQGHDRYGRLFHPQAVLGCFTRTRSQTAMTPEGTYADRSLRSMRVLNRGREFFFALEAPGEHRAAIEAACRVTRAMGMGRTRGLGEIRLELMDSASPVQEAMTTRDEGLRDGDACRIDLTIRTEAQVLASNRVGMSQTSGGCIPGGLILGALAGRYIKARSLAAPHTDEGFRSIFLDGSVRFSPAFPLDNEGRPTMPCPLSIVREKNSDKLFDLIRDEDRAGMARDETLQTRGCPAEWVCLEEGELSRASADFEVEYHHRRPEDKARGRAGETTQATGDEGAFFQFEVLSPGQTFGATITGPYGLLRQLPPLLAGNMTLHLGKSRTAQYGRCTVSMEGPHRVVAAEGEIRPGAQAVITLASDAIVLNGCGCPSADPNDLMGEMNRRHGISLEIETTWGTCAKSVRLGGFMGVWRLPRPQAAALKAGTVVRVKNTGQTPVSIDLLESVPYGQRTPEGFGRILVDRHGHCGTRDVTPDPEALQPGPSTNTLAMIKEKICRRALEDALSMEAVKRAGKAAADVPSSFLARMLKLVERHSTFDGLGKDLAAIDNKRAGTHAGKLADPLFTGKSDGQEGGACIRADEFAGMVSQCRQRLYLNELLPDAGKRRDTPEELYAYYQVYARACLTHLKLRKRS